MIQPKNMRKSQMHSKGTINTQHRKLETTKWNLHQGNASTKYKECRNLAPSKWIWPQTIYSRWDVDRENQKMSSKLCRARYKEMRRGEKLTMDCGSSRRSIGEESKVAEAPMLCKSRLLEQKTTTKDIFVMSVQMLYICLLHFGDWSFRPGP